jgi:ParB-like chromosome segregation protein Spo0J
VSVEANETAEESFSPAQRWAEGDAPVVRIPVGLLVPGDSARMDGENRSHVALMASASELPPIVVHRPTMQVIDGMHRLSAAKLQDQESVDVRFFDGTADEAFAIGVFANITHGLPLSRKDRKAAAVRILDTYPYWSDRRVGSTTGLSHHTIATLRKCAGGQSNKLNKRLGKDGKVRPLSGAAGRTAAAELIQADRTASLREVAKKAGVCPSTVRSVRSQLDQQSDQGGDPAAAREAQDHVRDDPQTIGPRRDVDEKRRGTISVGSRVASLAASRPSSTHAALKRLQVNPALRFSQDGRMLVRLLTISLANATDCERLADGAPEHCLNTVAEIASAIGDAWYQIAGDLRSKSACG